MAQEDKLTLEQKRAIEEYIDKHQDLIFGEVLERHSRKKLIRLGAIFGVPSLAAAIFIFYVGISWVAEQAATNASAAASKQVEDAIQPLKSQVTSVAEEVRKSFEDDMSRLRTETQSAFKEIGRLQSQADRMQENLDQFNGDKLAAVRRLLVAFDQAPDTVQEVVEKLAEVEQHLNQVKGTVDALEVPNLKSSVVAFDDSGHTTDPCPDGWEPFKEGRARMIIGAGDPSEAPGNFGADQSGRNLKKYEAREHGGAESHKLTPQEMPKHSHILNYRLAREVVEGGDFLTTNISGRMISTNFDDKGETEESPGEGEAHNNMPPFIALYFCKKK